MQRELPKRPDLPKNFSELIEDITNICFLPPQEEPVDVVFVFGNWTQKTQKPLYIEKLFKNNISNHFIITGGPPTHDYAHLGTKAVSDEVYASLSKDVLENCTIQLENTSTNSVEDIQHSLPFMQDFKQSKIGCVACNWSIGRQFLYLKKFFPEAQVYPMPYDTLLEDGTFLTLSNWHENTDGKQRLWGEITRFKLYGERGDMAYHDDLRQKIDNIFAKIKP